MKSKFFTTKNIAFTAMFTALVVVATCVIQIPSPAGQGYINVGDTMIFVCAALFNPLSALIAGGIGSALADVIVGYAFYAPYTLLVKGLEGLVAGLIVAALKKIKMPFIANCIIAMAAGALCMSVGYFLSETLLGLYNTGFSFGLALANMPFNLLQGAINVVLGAILTTALSNVRSLTSFIDFKPQTKK